MHFKDGQEIIDFLSKKGEGPHLQEGMKYLLLLDISMPKIDGIEVLKFIKSKKKLKRIPVIMVTTTNDPREINRCHELGCSNYIVKPVDYEQFVESIKNLSLFLLIIQIPKISFEL
jgi:CheY-like chemotaxis protein